MNSFLYAYFGIGLVNIVCATVLLSSTNVYVFIDSIPLQRTTLQTNQMQWLARAKILQYFQVWYAFTKYDRNCPWSILCVISAQWSCNNYITQLLVTDTLKIMLLPYVLLCDVLCAVQVGHNDPPSGQLWQITVLCRHSHPISDHNTRIIW